MAGAADHLPEGWAELRALVDAVELGGSRLYRWEERFAEDGDRLRAVHLAPREPVAKLEPLAAEMLARARTQGFHAAAAQALRDGDGRLLTIAPRQLPARIVLTVIEPRAWGGGMRVVPSPPPSEWARDPTRLPRVAALLDLTSRLGPTRVVVVDRFAEAAPDATRAEPLAPPTLRAILRGSFPLASLCAALAAHGYEEDGEAWTKDDADGRAEVRMRDGEVDLTWVPRELSGVAVAPLFRSTRPPPVR
jgi:hypothetical protein